MTLHKTLAAGMVAVAVLADTGVARAQSLAEIARMESARRGAVAQPGQVYTNTDLVPDFTKPQPPATAPPGDAPAAAAADAAPTQPADAPPAHPADAQPDHAADTPAAAETPAAAGSNVAQTPPAPGVERRPVQPTVSAPEPAVRSRRPGIR